MTMYQQLIETTHPDDTHDLARQIGACLVIGDVLLLSGGVGAGKTHFCRGLIQSLLREPEDIPSPTYTLIQTYETPHFEIIHADLYRLGNVDELEELGLSEAFSTSVCLIEWPDRLGKVTPPDALHLAFENRSGDDTRQIRIHADEQAWTQRWEHRLKRIGNV